MAIRTIPYINSAGGLVTINLRYDDATNTVSALVVSNASTGPVTLTVTDDVTGAVISRIWEPGQTETVAVPGVYRFDVTDTLNLAARFSTVFTGPAGA